MNVNEFFIYSTERIASLAAGVTATRVISIMANTSFVWQGLAVAADIAGAPQTESSRVIPLVDVIITDTGTGNQLMNGPVPLVSLAGSQGLPSLIPQPKIFKPSSNITVTFKNYSASTTYENLQLSFIGYQEFKF